MRGPSLRTAAVVFAALALGPTTDGHAQTPEGSATIVVTEVVPGVFRVEERFVIAPAPSALELRAFGRPCVEVRGARVTRGGTAREEALGRDGPWLVVRPSAAAGPSGLLDLTVDYEARTASGRASIPIFHPTVPIPQRDGEREGTVRLEVRLADAAGRVALPHMGRTSSTVWRARTVAVPSFIEVEGAAGSEPAGPCPAPVGDDGGLVWRFFLLVGIMGAWVPLYQAWARRVSETDA